MPYRTSEAPSLPHYFRDMSERAEAVCAVLELSDDPAPTDAALAREAAAQQAVARGSARRPPARS